MGYFGHFWFMLCRVQEKKTLLSYWMCASGTCHLIFFFMLTPLVLKHQAKIGRTKEERTCDEGVKRRNFKKPRSNSANVKPFISVFIWERVTTVAWPLLNTGHLKLGDGGWGFCHEWLPAAAAVENIFLKLAITAIFGAIKSSISRPDGLHLLSRTFLGLKRNVQR